MGVALTGTGAPEGDRAQGVNGMVLNTIDARDRQDLPLFLGLRPQLQARASRRARTNLREGVAGIFREDERILEAQQKAIDDNPDHIIYNLNIDAGSMWARRLIDRMVAEETIIREAAE